MSKKQLVTITAAVAFLASFGLTAAFTTGTLVAKSNNNQATSVLASTNDSLVDETIYVFTNPDGSTRRLISSDWTKSAGSDVYTKVDVDEAEAPLDLKVTYKLDGKTISAKDLAGRSGKVTVRYNFTNNDKDGNYYVPYTVVSGIILANDSFKNVEVVNGKLLNDGDHTVVAGITFPGMATNLGVSTSDFNVPEYFEFTADATDFELGLTISLATTRIFSDIDTSKLDSLDNIESQLNTLQSSMDQLVSGSSELYQGLIELYNKSVGSLATGVSQLADGSEQVKTGAEELSSYLSSYAADTQLSDGLAALLTSILSQVNSATGLNITIANYTDEEVATNYATYAAASTTVAQFKAITDPLYQLYVGALTSNAYATQFAAGAADLATGASDLSDGLQSLNSSTPALIEGIEKLRNGSGKLTDGLNAFNDQGVKKLVSAYENNLSGLSQRLKDIVALSKDHSKVKYIYRTDEIKK